LLDLLNYLFGLLVVLVAGYKHLDVGLCFADHLVVDVDGGDVCGVVPECDVVVYLMAMGMARMP
jgi:hypothetical protein